MREAHAMGDTVSLIDWSTWRQVACDMSIAVALACENDQK